MQIDTNKPYKIFAEHLDQAALDQFQSAMNCEFTTRGALMPDAHKGYSLPIGSVVETEGVIVPAWVGYDIGCGMCALKTEFSAKDVRDNSKQIFDEIYKCIPVGFSHNPYASSWYSEALNPSEALKSIFEKDGLKQLCSLGGGNHFIEIGESLEGAIWIIIHSGSRGIGHAVATHYMRIASGDGKAREGHYGLDVDSVIGKEYIADLEFCLAFALENRKRMIERVVSAIAQHVKFDGLNRSNLINRNHNHAELRDGKWIHRKGATHAELGMMGVIPGNMRDGSFIVRGKGNPDALYSSSHGAGRVLGRKKAQETLNMEEFKSSMKGITAKICEDTLDESAFAYKDIFEVMRLQSDLVDIVTHVRPIINIKG